MELKWLKTIEKKSNLQQYLHHQPTRDVFYIYGNRLYDDFLIEWLIRHDQ
jgi:hypothetical protein